MEGGEYSQTELTNIAYRIIEESKNVEELANKVAVDCTDSRMKEVLYDITIDMYDAA